MSRWKQLSVKFASRLTSKPCVYVISLNGRIEYVGKTDNLYMRVHGHRTYTGLDFRQDGIVVKYSVDRRFGEHLMREVRLIAKLNPPLNKAHKLSPWEMDNKPWVRKAA